MDKNRNVLKSILTHGVAFLAGAALGAKGATTFKEPSDPESRNSLTGFGTLHQPMIQYYQLLSSLSMSLAILTIAANESTGSNIAYGIDKAEISTIPFKQIMADAQFGGNVDSISNEWNILLTAMEQETRRVIADAILDPLNNIPQSPSTETINLANTIFTVFGKNLAKDVEADIDKGNFAVSQMQDDLQKMEEVLVRWIRQSKPNIYTTGLMTAITAFKDHCRYLH